MVQVIATGYLGSMVEGRQVIRQSFDVKTFEPRDSAAWEAAFERYLRIRKG
ncbi:MAG: hypothetical protein J7M39_01325 [Anaerolineae bacterium]|nr:hypothetical protein [Anaerolineae bacterium]